MKKILLVGGGGHCKSCIDVIEQQGTYEIAGIVDQPSLVGQKVLGYEVIGSDNDLQCLRGEFEYAFVTVGQIQSADLKIKLYKLLTSLNFTVPVIISPLAYVSKHAQIAQGTIVMHHALINAGARVGENCIINTKSLIEHDSVVENYCHISTGVTINGGVLVKQKSFIGSQSVTKEGVVIQNDSFVKAGTLVK